MTAKKMHYLPDYACGMGDNDIQYTKCAIYVPVSHVTRLWREVTCKRCLGPSYCNKAKRRTAE